VAGSASDRYAVVLEWSGGIGDVFYMTWVQGHYTVLDDLKPGERAAVVNRCRTPGLEELIKWHPKRDQIDLFDLSWHPSEVVTEADRAALGLPGPTPHIPLVKEPVFYPSPGDLDLLPSLTKRRYAVFALSGSFPEKNVPVAVADRIADLLIGMGITVVQVGKTYERRVPKFGGIALDKRVEERLTAREGVLDAIDRLTLPGTCELVRGAVAVVCCDSSIMHLSLRMKKPTFIVVPDKWFEYWITIDAASWGKVEPHASYTKVSEYSDDRIVRWVDKNNISGENR
jgi:hypothetical protein